MNRTAFFWMPAAILLLTLLAAGLVAAPVTAPRAFAAAPALQMTPKGDMTVTVSALSPLTVTVSPTSTVTVPVTSTGAAAANYDGEWEGRSSTDSLIAFRIENDELTTLNVNFSVESGPCQFLSGMRGKSAQNPGLALIEDDGFDALLDEGDGDVVVVTGTFSSTTQAAGTFRIEGNSSTCGDFQVEGTWMAEKIAAFETSTPEAPVEEERAEPEADETAEALPTTALIEEMATLMPEAVPTAATSADTPDARVLLAFFDALNAGDVEAALKQANENMVLTSGETTIIGKAGLESYLEGQVARGVTYTVSQIQDWGGGTLTFSLQIGSGPVTDYQGAVIVDGKLFVMTLR